MRKIIIILFLFISTLTLTAQNQKIADGMVFISGATFQMGIEEHELVDLAEMGKKVPHMSIVHSRWWFADEMPMDDFCHRR